MAPGYVSGPRGRRSREEADGRGRAGEPGVAAVERLADRDAVEQRGPRDPDRVVQYEAQGDVAATVVPGEKEQHGRAVAGPVADPEDGLADVDALVGEAVEDRDTVVGTSARDRSLGRVSKLSGSGSGSV